MRKMVMVVLCLAALVLKGGAKGDEIGDLKQQLEQLQQRLEQLEAAQKTQEQQVDDKIAKAVEDTQIDQKIAKAVEEKQFALPETMKWVENVKFNGDFRYRYEFIDEEGSDNRNRNRIRARIGLTARVNEDINLGFRLATSENWGDDDAGDPVSTNQTLDDAFSKKSIWFDLAYFDWHPGTVKGLHIIGGKMENPFYRVGGNQLIWDSDLTPEGIAVQYTGNWTEQTSWFANAGSFYVDEVKSGADTSLWGAQGGLKHTFQDKSYILGGASLYCLGNIQGHEAFVTDDGVSKFYGNRNTGNGGVYLSDYDLTEFFGEYGFNLGPKPAALFADYVQNNVADSNQDTAWLVGGKYGKCKDPGSWELSYDYRDVEADAVVGAFSDSDFIGGGTNGKGHRLGATYQLAKNTQTALSYFLNEKGNDRRDYDRLQFDLLFKF